MKSLDFRLILAIYYFDSRVLQLTNELGFKRIDDAKKKIYSVADINNGQLAGYPTEPPWCFKFNDPCYLLQSRSSSPLNRFIQTIRSPEWMLVITARMLKSHGMAFGVNAIEYKLTHSNLLSSQVPDKLSATEYMWWRLEKYFGINKSKHCFLRMNSWFGFLIQSLYFLLSVINKKHSRFNGKRYLAISVCFAWQK